MESFLKVIDLAEREIRRDREDLERLKKRYPGYDFLQVNGTSVSSVNREKPLSGIEQAILTVIESLPEQEWTSRSVVAAIRSGGIFLLANSDDAAMNAVTIALASLTETGRIRRTHQGSGRDPHRYQANEKEVHSIEQTP
jgi:hypothetical protein